MEVLLEVLREYGLPLAILAAAAWLTVTGRVVPGPTHKDALAQRDRALDLVYEMAQGIKQAAQAVNEQGPGKGRGGAR